MSRYSGQDKPFGTSPSGNHDDDYDYRYSCVMSLVLVWIRTIQLRYVPCACVSSYNTAAQCRLREFVNYSCIMFLALLWVRTIQMCGVSCPCVSSYNTKSALCPLSLCEFVQYSCVMSLVLVWIRTIQSRYVRCSCVGPYNTVCMMSLILVCVRNCVFSCPCVSSYNTNCVSLVRVWFRTKLAALSLVLVWVCTKLAAFVGGWVGGEGGGLTGENSHVVFRHKHLRSFEPFNLLTFYVVGT